MSSRNEPVTFRDKLLPTQPVLSDLFNGTSQQLNEGIYEAITRFADLKMPADEFDIEMSDKVPLQEMASSPMMLRLLQCLIRISRSKRILEIGTFLGISAMYMASALDENGSLTTIEKFDHFAEIARRNFARNKLDRKIELIEGDAFTILSGMDKSRQFDFIFLDGNKERYDAYFQLLDPWLVPGGMFVTDDVFFHGDALNQAPVTEKGAGVRRFLELASTKANYSKVILPVMNGFMLMLKNS